MAVQVQVQGSDVGDDLPPVAYVKAVDIWIGDARARGGTFTVAIQAYSIPVFSVNCS